MTSYTNIFDGQTVSPAYPNSRDVALTGNQQLEWPSTLLNTANIATAVLFVTSNNSANELALPDAMLVSPGQLLVICNIGSNNFIVTDFAGTQLFTAVTPGQQYFVILRNNSTQAGVWGSILAGSGTSGASAAALAGYGLIAIDNLLNLNMPITIINTDTTLLPTNRASFQIWKGGAGTITLTNPADPAITNGYLLGIANQTPVAGQVNLVVDGGATIDGLTSFPMFDGDSFIFDTDGINYYTIGNNSNSSNNSFGALSLVIPTGATTVTLTPAQARKQIQIYTGVLTANVKIIVPTTAAEYFVYNATTGSFTLSIGSSGSNTYVVPQGTRDIFWHNGASDLFDAITSLTNLTVTGIVKAASGSAGAPSLTFTNDVTTGIYLVGTGKLGLTTGGNGVNLIMPESGSIGLGLTTLDSVTSGTNNTSMGTNAATALSSGARNTILGSLAFINSTIASDCVAIGYAAMSSNVSGLNSVAIGSAALQDCTVGNNTGIGYNAMLHTSTGTQNVGIGNSVLGAQTIATGNVAIGYITGLNLTTASNNTLIGMSAGNQILTNGNNVAIGANANQSSGSGNTVVGASALSTSGSSSSNSGLGFQVFTAMNAGSGGNTAVGNNAGASQLSYSNCTFLGSGADASVNGLTNSTTIGANASVSTSNTLVLGATTGAATSVIIGAPTNSAGGYTLNLMSANNSASLYFARSPSQTPPSPNGGVLWVNNSDQPIFTNATNSYNLLTINAFSVVQQIFTGSATYTPTINMAFCIIECIGGGGGAAGAYSGATAQAGGGGGGGAYGKAVFSAATIGASQAVTIGSAGVGENPGISASTSGGATSVGALMNVLGGGNATAPSIVPGAIAQICAPGNGASAAAITSSAYYAAGSAGGIGWCAGTAGGGSTAVGFTGFGGGKGGYGGGTNPLIVTQNSFSHGNDANANSGSGGGGGFTSDNADRAMGGNGSAGVVIITEYIYT